MVDTKLLCLLFHNVRFVYGIEVRCDFLFKLSFFFIGFVAPFIAIISVF